MAPAGTSKVYCAGLGNHGFQGRSGRLSSQMRMSASDRISVGMDHCDVGDSYAPWMK